MTKATEFTEKQIATIDKAIETNPDMFRDDFRNWLVSNKPVWTEFAKRAKAVAKTGKEKFSARTIAESMRWDFEMGNSKIDYKVNNNFVPDMARLFTVLNPKYESLFSMRSSVLANAA